MYTTIHRAAAWGRRRCAQWLLLLVCTAPAAAEELTYRVQPGDTLIDIGYRLLETPRDWQRVQELNGLQDPYRLKAGSRLRIPVAWLRPLSRAAQVVTVSGEVRIDGHLAAPGTRIAAGSRLQTGADGHLVLRLPDGSRVTLPADSALDFDALTGYRGLQGTDVELGLQRGRVESQVAPQRGPAARYRVDTPTAVIGVRGTGFRVAAAEGGAEVRAEVTTGSVSVSAVDAAPGQAAEQTVAAGYGLVVRPGEPLTAPVSLLPAPPLDGVPGRFTETVVQIPLPVVAGARAWRVQVSADRPGAPVLVDRAVRGHVASIGGLADGDYLLTLRAVDAQGLEGHDARHRFTLAARPEPPFLTQPADGAKVVTGRVEFRWTEAPEAAHYRIEIAEATRPAEPLFARDDLEAAAVAAELAPGRYRWRVASVRADGYSGPWSAPVLFEVRPLAATPEAPAVEGNEVQFRWSGEAGQRFEYQLAEDPAFAAVIAEGTVDQPRASLPLPLAGSYWMRVRAVDPDGFVSPWSGAQKLVVASGFKEWTLLLLPLLAL